MRPPAESADGPERWRGRGCADAYRLIAQPLFALLQVGWTA